MGAQHGSRLPILPDDNGSEIGAYRPFSRPCVHLALLHHAGPPSGTSGGGGVKSFERSVAKTAPQPETNANRHFVKGCPLPDPRNARPRKPRTDSISNLVRIAQAARQELAPPAHVPLPDEAWPYWHSLVEEQAKADWSPHQLELAAMLARTLAALEAEQRTLSAEGSLGTGSRGVVVQNPRNRVVRSLSDQVLAMRRTLGLTARASAGSSEDAARQRIQNRSAEIGLRERDPSGLLA